MASSISKSRLRKAFNEGRRSAGVDAAQNPYDNAKLQRLWEQGRSQQRAGALTTPIPALDHGETRAQRAKQNPPGSGRAAAAAARHRGGHPRGGPTRPQPR